MTLCFVSSDDNEGTTIPVVVETETVDRYKKFSISVVLSEFTLQLFKNEPSLVSLNKHYRPLAKILPLTQIPP